MSALAPALAGTLWLAVLTAAFSVPLGVGTAIYLEEYAPRTRTVGLIKSVLTNLAGVPSVVYGMAGLALFVRGWGLGPSILAGGLTLVLLTLPLVVANVRKALRSVPEGLRWAAFGLGATRWQVLRHQVLPAAAPGIVTGCLAALSRAVTATAPLLILGTASFMTFVPSVPADPLAALPTQIFAWAARPHEDYLALAAGASVALLLLVGAMRLTLRALHGKPGRVSA